MPINFRLKRVDDLKLKGCSLPWDRRYFKKGNQVLFQLKLSYECSECENEWTTASGTCNITFRVENSTDESPSIVNYCARIYSQNCLECGKLGEIEYYTDEVVRISDCFLQVVQTSIQGYLSSPIHVGMQRPSRMRSSHKESHC